MLQALKRRGAALDASDTGTGKTFTTLAICRELGVTPLVLGPKNSRATWEDASELFNWPVEWINYEMVRGRRELRGGIEVDTLVATENRNNMIECPVFLQGYRNGKCMFKREQTWYDFRDTLQDANLPIGEEGVLYKFGEWKCPEPVTLFKVRTSESDWVEEVKYGKGSFIKWKQNYEAIVFDEVHRCGGSTTLNSKLLIAAKRQAKFVITLSATAADHPQQMKALGFALGLHDLNNPKTGYRSWLWRHGCFEDEERGGMRFTDSDIRREETFAKLHEEIFPVCGARMRKKEIANFPRTNIQIKYLSDETGKAAKLSGKLKDLYEEYDENAKTTGDYATTRQALELLMIPDTLDLFADVVNTSRIAIFVNYTVTLEALFEELRNKYGHDKIGRIDGSQTGKTGEKERTNFVHRFQLNELAGIVCNAQAAGENIGLHDPAGIIDRTTIIFPCDSGRRLKQLVGRVDRAGGADSNQYLLYFKGTAQEETAKRVQKRLTNIELLNDHDLR